MADAQLNAGIPDTLPNEAPSSPLEQFLEKNFKKILIALAVLVVLLIGIGYARHLSRQTELEAATAFTSAKTTEDCDVVAQRYSGTTAAGNALLLKASLLWNAGKKESSVGVLQDFIKNQPDHLLLPYARISLGSKQASLGEKDAARTTLQAIVRDYPKSEPAAAAETQLGDILWSEGKVDEARKVFTDLPRNYPGSPFIDEVNQRIKAMDAGLPSKEVDAPPPPPKPAAAPAPALPSIPGIPKPSATPPTINVPSLIPTPPAPPAGASAAPPAPAPAPSSTPPPAPAPAPSPKADATPPAPAAPAAPAPAAPEAPKP
jgi:predicted negative regulator of RcsB-dependent stress response